MDKSPVTALLFFVILAGSLLAYLTLTTKAEGLARQTWHNAITRNLVMESEQISFTDTNHVAIGLYRPELPYNVNSVRAIEDSLKAPVSIISFYQAWGESEVHEFALDACKDLHTQGFTPMITWEPWIQGFSQFRTAPSDSTVPVILSGRLDSYIKQWARSCVSYAKPIFVRIAHEVSNAVYPWGPEHGVSPEMYASLWRHIHTIFTEQGASNALFVWTPFVPADTLFFPGTEVVDWIGLDIFNFGSFSASGLWIDYYSVTKSLYDHVTGYNLPIMIAELGSTNAGGNKINWFRQMVRDMANNQFPEIKSIVFFDTPVAKTPGGLSVDLGISSEQGLLRALDTLSAIAPPISGPSVTPSERLLWRK